MDNPMPVPGRAPVTMPAILAIIEAINEQAAKGREHYGTALMTHNGRDAGLDAMQELADAVVYVQQLRMEHADALQEIDRLKQRVAELEAIKTPERGCE